MRELEWYKHFVHNRTIIGSLFTLIHPPFLFAFLSLVIIGLIPLQTVDNMVLGLSLAVVFLLLYAEHMIDDMTIVGKPWQTVFSDTTLVGLNLTMFFGALLVGLYGNTLLDSKIPLFSVSIGAAFCWLYGLEIWKFHTVGFGATGMAAIPIASYLAQLLAVGGSADIVIIGLLGILGFTYGYVMLALYEHTKTQEYKIAWKLLGVHFIMIYGLAGVLMFLRYFK